MKYINWVKAQFNDGEIICNKVSGLKVFFLSMGMDYVLVQLHCRYGRNVALLDDVCANI